MCYVQHENCRPSETYSPVHTLTVRNSAGRNHYGFMFTCNTSIFKVLGLRYDSYRLFFFMPESTERNFLSLTESHIAGSFNNS